LKDLQNYSLLAHNTFAIDAHCRRFVEYASTDELRAVLPSLKGDRVLHIGGGSNLLFTDFFDGVILHSAVRGRRVVEADADTALLEVGGGESFDETVDFCIQNGLYGLENLSLIPGEVGAAAVQNIGAYGAEAAQFIERVEAIDLESGETRFFSNSDCHYAYRQSVFKGELRGRCAIVRVSLRLKKNFAPNFSYAALSREVEARGLKPDELTAADVRRIVIELRCRKLPEVGEVGSAGSFFMNPVVSAEQFARIQTDYPDAPHYDVEGGVKVPAGWLIDRCGWKGRRIGAAGVWPEQALVLVNYGGATGAEIAALSADIQKDVLQKFGIALHPEVNFV